MSSNPTAAKILCYLITDLFQVYYLRIAIIIEFLLIMFQEFVLSTNLIQRILGDIGINETSTHPRNANQLTRTKKTLLSNQVGHHAWHIFERIFW